MYVKFSSTQWPSSSYSKVSCPSPIISFIMWFCVCVGLSAAPAAESLQSCPTLCDPIDLSPPASPMPGILQARTLEWVAISFSNAWKWKVKVKSLSCVRPSATAWTAAYQAPLSMGFSRQVYWSGVPLPSPVGLLMSYLYQWLVQKNIMIESYCSIEDT